MATEGEIYFKYHGNHVLPCSTIRSYHTILGKKRIHQVSRTFYFLKDYFGPSCHCKLSLQYDCNEALAFKQEGWKLDLIMLHRGKQWIVFSSFCVQEERGDSTTIPAFLVRGTV